MELIVGVALELVVIGTIILATGGTGAIVIPLRIAAPAAARLAG